MNHATSMEPVLQISGGRDFMRHPEGLSMFEIRDKTQGLSIAMRKAGTVQQPCRAGEAIVCCCNLRAGLSDLS